MGWASDVGCSVFKSGGSFSLSNVTIVSKPSMMMYLFRLLFENKTSPLFILTHIFQQHVDYNPARNVSVSVANEGIASRRLQIGVCKVLGSWDGLLPCAPLKANNGAERGRSSDV